MTMSVVEVLRRKFIPIRFQTIDQHVPKIIELHGERIFDFYDWLKNDTEQKEKILAHEELTLRRYVNANLQRNDWHKVRQIFCNLTDYELFSEVVYRHWYIFYTYLNVTKSIYKPIFYRARSLKGLDPHVVLDSNQISGNVVDYDYSPNGEYCAFTIARDKPNSLTIETIEVETGKIFQKCVRLNRLKKFVWSGDSKGFFIFYDPRGGENRHLYYHYLDKRKRDKFVRRIFRAETNNVTFRISADYKYLILRDSRSLSIANIESLDDRIIFRDIFIMSPGLTYEYVGNDGDMFIFLTNFDAPKHKLIQINVMAFHPLNEIEVVVTESFDGHGVLSSAYKYTDYLFLIYIENLQSSFYLFSLERKRIEYQIDLQNEKFLSAKIDEFGFYFETQSFETPQNIYKIDFCQLVYRPPFTQQKYSIIKPILKRKSKIPNLNDEKFSIQRDSFYSFDGKEVPITIIQKNDGIPKKPCLVFAYGGYGIPMLPFCKLFFLLFIELFNGIVVIIYIRGGGELGDDWLLESSEAETSFRDLIAGVEYLKRAAFQNIIDSSKIAFHGTSHGGLAGAVVINKKRDLFRAVIIQNANMDLINDLPSKGRIWAKQYGDLNKKEDYKNIKKYAPLLHIKEPKTDEDSYPSTLIIASKNDEIVSITNSLKYLAHRRLISVYNELHKDNPTLLKVIYSGGHHYETAAKDEYIDTVFVELKFLAETMQMKFDQKYASDP